MLLLVFFSAMIGFMAAFKPLIIGNKKAFLSEQQQACSCPESGCDGETDEETNKEDLEWDDKFYLESYPSFCNHFAFTHLRTFSYVVHTSEYFASISIPPPEIVL